MLSLFSCSRFCPVGLYAQQPLENLLSPAHLPQLKDGRMLQLSSGDTTGGNSDFVAIPPGQTAVIADVRGPGMIVGMWFTIMSSDKHFLRQDRAPGVLG